MRGMSTEAHARPVPGPVPSPPCARRAGPRTGTAAAALAVALALASLAVPERRPVDVGADGTDERGAAGPPAAAATAFSCGASLATGSGATGSGAVPARAAAAPPPARLIALREALYASASPDGGLSGDGERVECRGASADVYPVLWRFDLEGVRRVRALDGALSLDAFESRHTVIAPRDARLVDGTVVAESVSLPPVDTWTAAPDGNGLVATLGARRAGAAACAASRAGRCTVALDVGWRLGAVGDALELEQTLWVGGRAAGRVVWRLRPA